MAVAAVNEASDVEQRLILLREPALRKEEGDRASALRPCIVVRHCTHNPDSSQSSNLIHDYLLNYLRKSGRI